MACSVLLNSSKPLSLYSKQAPLGDHAQQPQHRDPAGDPPIDAGQRAALFAAFGHGEGHRRANQEQEGRHHQVPGDKAFPTGMGHLGLEGVAPGRIEPGDQGQAQLASADEPEHGEASQRVQRDQALFGRRRGRREGDQDAPSWRVSQRCRRHC